ncbi:MAG: hypothetical protein GX660_12510 [Clostridiaceae bacterium]|nr:hypothetical protein [Clostridiaceae bacterium]
MAKLISLKLRQINTALSYGYEPSIDLLIHWLNPLYSKCRKRLFSVGIS